MGVPVSIPAINPSTAMTAKTMKSTRLRMRPILLWTHAQSRHFRSMGSQFQSAATIAPDVSLPDRFAHRRVETPRAPMAGTDGAVELRL